MLKNVIGFVTTLVFGLTLGSVASAQALNFAGLWWNPQEPGWGVAVDQQADIVFAAWATYDLDGSPVWFVMPRAEHLPDDPIEGVSSTYQGAIYRLTGPAFGAVPFDSSMVTATMVGGGGFHFPLRGDNGVGVFYNGLIRDGLIGWNYKSIKSQVFADPVPICAVGATPGPIPNYQGMWWNAPAGSESGWGIHFTHQGDIIFAVWFTYDAAGKATWLVMTATKTAPNTYAGAIYRTTGPAYNAATFDPSAVTATQVGSATLTFTDRDNGALAYAVNTVSQTKNITRQIFADPPTVCN